MKTSEPWMRKKRKVRIEAQKRAQAINAKREKEIHEAIRPITENFFKF